MLDRVSLKTKMTGLIGLPVLLVGILLGFALVGLSQLGDSVQMQTEAAKLLRCSVTADMFHDAVNADVMYAMSETAHAAVDSSVEAKGLERFKEHRASFLENMEAIKQLARTPEIQVALQHTLGQVDQYLQLAERVISPSARFS